MGQSKSEEMNENNTLNDQSSSPFFSLCSEKTKSLVHIPNILCRRLKKYFLGAIDRNTVSSVKEKMGVVAF